MGKAFNRYMTNMKGVILLDKTKHRDHTYHPSATMKATMLKRGQLETTGTLLTVIKRQGQGPGPDRRRNPQGVDRELQIRYEL